MTDRRMPPLFFWLGAKGDDDFPQCERRYLSDIQRIVAEHFQVPFHTMTSGRRDRNMARPRQVAMYLASRYTRMSKPEMGRRFGGRDHSTIIHGIRQIERLRMCDPDMDASIRALAKQVEAA